MISLINIGAVNSKISKSISRNVTIFLVQVPHLCTLTYKGILFLKALSRFYYIFYYIFFSINIYFRKREDRKRNGGKGGRTGREKKRGREGRRKRGMRGMMREEDAHTYAHVLIIFCKLTFPIS